MSENLKTLLQQALDMLEEQALHIEAPMLPAGEELLKRIRAATSQHAEPEEPAPAQDEREAYKCTPKNGGEPFVIRRVPDSWELRECEIEVVSVQPDDSETDQSIAADCYWHIADVMGTQPCWSVQEHVEFTRRTLEEVYACLKLDDKGKLDEVTRRVKLCLTGVAPGYTPPIYTTRLAQTEQQPIGYACQSDLGWEEEPVLIHRYPFRDWQVPVYAAPIAQTAPQHPDDEAVDRFAVAMKAKLAAARAKGRGGWENKDLVSDDRLAEMLVEHLGKGNTGTFEDVANFAMMLHQRGADPKVLADAAPIAQTAQGDDQ